MALAATLLFGSVARGDQSEGSDTDLLMINLDEEMRHVSVGHLSLYLYPWHQLEQDARDGDLFVCHLVREAKALVDPDNYLTKLREAFRFKPNYQDEICQAVDFGWFLVRFGAELNSSLQAKRVLWCIRTILIARSAERLDPVFAPRQLAEQTQSAAARDLLSGRRRLREGKALRQSLRHFLEGEAQSDPNLMYANRETLIERFFSTHNKVALQTLAQEEKSQSSYI
jgi:predicted nucleotidyltransferase